MKQDLNKNKDCKNKSRKTILFLKQKLLSSLRIISVLGMCFILFLTEKKKSLKKKKPYETGGLVIVNWIKIRKLHQRF